MTPTQREAALRLIARARLEGVSIATAQEAFELLRELAATVAENATVEPQDEPVAYVDHADGAVIWKQARLPGGSLLYSHPQQQRKPLTHMQVVLLWGHRSDGPSNSEIVSFARAIERANGIGEAP